MSRYFASLAVLTLFGLAVPAAAQQLPADAQATCVASPQLFKSWFVAGSVSPDGAVNPADSLDLDTSTNCDFYLWSQQMHLWLLSPAPAGYGGSGRVFDSDVFFDVSEPNASGQRYFVPHVPLAAGASQEMRARRMVGLRPAKPGPNGLPAVLDREGNLIEVLPADLGPHRQPMLLGANGKKVEAARVSVAAGKAVFRDAAGNVISQPKLTIPARLAGARVGQRFFTEDGTPIIVGSGGLVFDVSPGQAGGAGVLLAQNASVVYYSMVANDVYAYFASGVNSGKIQATLFPTTQTELDTIQNFAGQTFPDGKALAVEVKLSWVDVSAVADPSAYVTSPAYVPTYDTSDPKKWVPTGEKLTTLALVGVHFVGSAKGHPEMIWSTFEHFGNAPTGQFQYVNQNNQTITVPANSAGKWVLSAAGSSGPFNVVHANYQSPPDIQGSTVDGQQFDVSPSDTQLVYAFGVAPMGQPNQEDLTPAAANTSVISANNTVLSQLAGGDLRSNYYFVGSTWTFGGYTPTGQYNPTTNNGNGSEIGTNRLANSTMETYHQAPNSVDPPAGSGSNCFSCHKGGPVGQKATTVVSHIFSDMLPLGSFVATSPTDAPPPQVITTFEKSGSAKPPSP